jgi:hypothetical protein
MIWSCLPRTNRKTNNDLFRPQFFRRSGDIDDEFAGRFPGFDVALCLRNLRQGVNVLDPEPDFFIGDPIQNSCGAGAKAGSVRNVMSQARPGKVQRPFLCEDERIDRWDRPAGITE